MFLDKKGQNLMRHALTVDVEDYFHVAAFAKAIKVDDWGNWPSRVEGSTRVLLDLCRQRDVKATFFILGWVAERYPELVREIYNEGHEIGCHGMSHQLIYEQSPKVFKQETIRAKHIIEDIVGVAVNGYRAASYSITPRSLWALDILIDAGFKYDSSIFPVRHDRYGMPGAPPKIHIIERSEQKEIVEFPLTSSRVFGHRIPVAGGGYFRIYPYMLTKMLLGRAVKELDQPFVFYLHPWEVDPEQPRVEGASMLSRFRHYTNLSRCKSRLDKLMTDFSFTTIENVLKDNFSNRDMEKVSYEKFKPNS